MADKKTTKKPVELAEESLDQISGGPNLTFIKILGVKDDRPKGSTKITSTGNADDGIL